METIMFDDVTDDELYKRYFFERIKINYNELPELLASLADKWKASESQLSFSDFICQECSDITGIPDFEHFKEYEMLNARNAEGYVELVPSRWMEKIGMSYDEMHRIHQEHSHMF